MIYTIEDKKIKVHDKTQFNPVHILECGQVFRYGKDDDGNYHVISRDKRAKIEEKEDFYEITTTEGDTEYFVNYFDLNTDYNIIKQKLAENTVLSPMIEYGYGIRILRADPEEMIYSFIISQNNNISRIKKIIEKMCEVGAGREDFKAFPTSKTLAMQPEDFYSGLGAGYRDKFLKSTALFLSNENLEEVKKLSTDEIYSYLMGINGVGPKVASCILLFGFSRMEKFPVDTWLEQVYYNHFSKEKRNRNQIQQYFENQFGKYSGLAQQYLFYYERNHGIDKK